MRAIKLPFLAALLLLVPAEPAAQAPRPNRPPGQDNPAANAAAAPAQDTAAVNQGSGAAVPAIQEEGDAYVLNFAEIGEEGMTLEDFVKVCQDATGRNFTYSKETADPLRNNKVRMFGTKRIPKRDFYAFFQIMMFINDFACVEVGPPHLSVIVIHSLGGTAGRPQTGGGSILNKPIYVLQEDLPQYEDQPAVLVRTVVHLPNTDVRNLVNSLRTVQTQNQQYDSMINAGQSNAIILTGFGSSVAAQVKLLLLIDQASRIDEGVEPIFDVIKLEFAAPEDVADIVEQLLEARNKANQDLRRNIPVNAEGGGPAGARASTDAKILVDSRTSSLLIMAMPEDMPRIKDLVARLDVDVVEPERNYHIYNLSNVKANDLQKVLKDFLQDASRVTESSGTSGGRAPGTASSGSSSRGNEVVVIADAETNSLLIAASKTRYAEVLDLIRQLDKRQPQVLIETALIELTGDESRDIGVELGFADIPGTGGTGGVGVTSFGLSSFVDSDNDGIPDQKVPSVLNGMTGGIIDGDDFSLPFLLRLFQSRTNTNVLNIPSVLVNNNGKAVVTTLDEQPTTTITAQGAGTTTQETFNGYQEAGITLTISPSISASRYLRLNVKLKVSSFIGTFSGAIPPPRITREIETEVNVPDGDTMVIGGIITDNQSETRASTPWLGDLPLIGPLFRRDTDSNERTTLYFFVTPHILKDEDFADLSEISYRKKLAAAEVMGKNRMDIVDPKFSTSGGANLGGGFEIPLYRSPSSGEVASEAVGLDAVRQAELLRAAQQAPAQAEPVKPVPAQVP